MTESNLCLIFCLFLITRMMNFMMIGRLVKSKQTYKLTVSFKILFSIYMDIKSMEKLI